MLLFLTFISAAYEIEERMTWKTRENLLKLGKLPSFEIAWFNVIESFSGWHVSGQAGGLWDFQERLLQQPNHRGKQTEPEAAIRRGQISGGGGQQVQAENQ